MNNLVGKQIGNYRLLSLLGCGGFADVYLAENIHLNRWVAIKVLKKGLDMVYVQQFLKEARTLVQLEHPHIIRVLDFSPENPFPYLVMDYAPGGTLRERHPRGSHVPLDTIVSYIKQVASALQYAHDQKKVHHDVKPENMLLNAKDEVQLSDFGLVDSTQTFLSRTQSVQDATIKKWVGTPIYMAPEQFRKRARRSSDQYSLGVVVYEWLSGNPPFEGSSIALEYQHHHKDPPSLLQEKNSAISVAVEEVVMRALAKEPQHRFESIQLFAEALENASHEALAHSSINQNIALNQSLISTLVRTPLKPLQPSKQVEDQAAQTYSASPMVQPARQFSQIEDKTNVTKQPLRSVPKITPLNQLSQISLPTYTTPANSLQEIEELEQGREDEWIRLRWFILASALLTPIMFSIGFFLGIPIIAAMSLIPGVMCLILGLLEAGHFNQWYWFVGFLLLSPLTGPLYVGANPAMKPDQPINIKQLVIVLSCLGYALFPVAIFISNWPATSNGPTWFIWYMSLGLMLSGWLLGFIHAIRSGKLLRPFFSPLLPFAGLITVLDSNDQGNRSEQE
ncbi:MAG: serine/threonine protein kinase [Chloroflexota bacterium]|nr:serine/threonine protein kinase [Chloroflexota bacterium]